MIHIKTILLRLKKWCFGMPHNNWLLRKKQKKNNYQELHVFNLKMKNVK